MLICHFAVLFSSNQHRIIAHVKPGFHMIVTVGDASPRQARGHIGDSCAKWKHFLNDVADVADQTGTVRGRIERVEMSLKPGFHVIIAVIVSICCRLIGDTSPMCRSRSPTVTIIWKPGFSPISQPTLPKQTPIFGYQ